MSVLITGASGQDGYYLSKLCLEMGLRVIRAGRSGPDVPLDVAEADRVEAIIREVQPDYVFHFSADSTLAHEAVLPNHAAIATGAVNILEACWRHSRGTRVFLPGSGAQFENNGRPIDENTPFAGESPYAVTRIYTDYLARYFRKMGLHCYVGYLFHHDSPLRTRRHLSQKIAQAAREIACGSRERLTVGSMSVEKEWVFAGDTVRAIWMLVNQDEIFEAVIGSGQAHPVRTWVRACFRAAGIDSDGWVDELPGFRPDFERMVSNPARISGLGWSCSVSLEKLAEMMVGAPVGTLS